MAEPEETARATLSALSGRGKTVLASFLGEKSAREARTILQKGGIPQYPVPERAVRVLRGMIAYRRIREAGPPGAEESGGELPAGGGGVPYDALFPGERTRA